MMAEEIRVIDSLWILKTDAGYKIGLTNQTQEELGTVTFVSLPKVGQVLAKGDSLIEAEAEKSVSDFSAPLSGKISRINEAVEDDASILNDPDQEKAWFAVIDAVDEAELDK